MTLYLARETALAALRYLRTRNVDIPPELRRTRRRAVTSPVDTVAKLRGMSHEARELLSELPRPLHVLTNDPNLVRHGKQLVTHLCSVKPPEGAFVDLGDDVFMSSPAFTFVHLATTYTRGGLVMLGLELCGNYSPTPQDPGTGGRPVFRSKPEGGGMAYWVPPQLRAAELGRFVERCKGLPGVSEAQIAAKWVLDNSSSPQESAAYVLLSLPRRYGGYGLPKPLFNTCVRVTSADGWKDRYPDLYWREHSVDVEYQSDFAHTGNKEAFYADSRRQVQLTAREVRVLPLTRRQLYSRELLEEFAYQLGRLTRHPVRSRQGSWAALHESLRDAALFDRPLREKCET